MKTENILNGFKMWSIEELNIQYDILKESGAFENPNKTVAIRKGMTKKPSEGKTPPK